MRVYIIKNCSPLYKTYRPTHFSIYLPKSEPTYRGVGVNVRCQTPKGQPATNPEMSLQIVLFVNVNSIKGSSMATSSIRYPQRRSKDKNITGRCVTADTLLHRHAIHKAFIWWLLMKCEVKQHDIAHPKLGTTHCHHVQQIPSQTSQICVLRWPVFLKYVWTFTVWKQKGRYAK